MGKPREKFISVEDMEYLGDGVYAAFRSENILLMTSDGLGITNTIYLEKDVFGALLLYALKKWPALIPQ